MAMNGLQMAWVVVGDLDAALTFYTETVGLTLRVHDKEHGWAEVEGPNKVGLGLSLSWEGFKPGDNAISVFIVDDICKARDTMKGADFVGDIVEVPGHVKLQMIRDPDGNHFQLCQRIG